MGPERVGRWPSRRTVAQLRRPVSVGVHERAVRTQPGHNTLTPTGRPTIFVVLKSSSLGATTACLLAV
jgi:hypothetical protein